VRAGVLLRSDAPHPDHRPADVAWPPRTVIDLRSSGELAEQHPLAAGGATVHAVSLSRHMSVADMARHGGLLADGLEGLYRTTMQESGAKVAEVVALVASAEPAVLLHCAAGKDRTGLVVATVLASLGAAREHIVADYVRTRENMPAVIERLTAEGEPGAEAMRALVQDHPEGVDAPPSAIEAALDVLDAAGGARAWLAGHGVGEDVLDRLADRLVDSEPFDTVGA